MPSREKLTDEAVQAALSELPAWELEDGKLHRKYEFPDFTHAFGFMAAAATQIQALNHHPEWTNVYGKVDVSLSKRMSRDSGRTKRMGQLMCGIARSNVSRSMSDSRTSRNSKNSR